MKKRTDMGVSEAGRADAFRGRPPKGVAAFGWYAPHATGTRHRRQNPIEPRTFHRPRVRL